MAVRTSGRDARTAYTVRDDFERVALLECALETGRTHQIRVHLGAIGHPVVGDELYGGRRAGLGAELDRPFLHAHRLGFSHPRTGDRVELESPLPPELARVLVILRHRGESQDG
jgi:23S rRNA pseudouridine1911/1915/1917 synthase